MANKTTIPGTGISFHKGGLHESLGVPQGKPIPASKLAAAKAGKYGPKAQKQANLASTLEGMNHSRKSLARAAAGR